MTLAELYDQLAYGELSQHSIGKNGSIADKDKPRIIHSLNAALTKLYAYFPIREREVILEQFEHITQYRLNSLYALSNTESTEMYKWVRDSVALPFLDDIVRIERIYDETGNRVPLNNEFEPNSVFTSGWDTIQVPFPNENVTLFIMYRAKHEKFTVDTPEETEIYLPPVLTDALQAFIASKAFVALGNAQSAALATFYKNKFSEEIAYVERENLLNSSEGESNTGLEQKGFM